MYKIERKPFGYKLSFGGFVQADEMESWVEESRKELSTAPPHFGVFVDMRELKPLAPNAKDKMEEGQKLFKAKGMERSVVILSSALIVMQFRQIAKDTGIDQWERYIDASKIQNWEEQAIAWITEAKEPEL